MFPCLIFSSVHSLLLLANYFLNISARRILLQVLYPCRDEDRWSVSQKCPEGGWLNLLQMFLMSHTAWSGAQRGGRSVLPPQAGQKAVLWCNRGGSQLKHMAGTKLPGPDFLWSLAWSLFGDHRDEDRVLKDWPEILSKRGRGRTVFEEFEALLIY